MNNLYRDLAPITAAAWAQIEEEAGHDVEKIGAKILEIVGQRGKQQNPVTGSGGMFIGKIAHIGEDLKDRDLKVGDKIASLVSLSMTPLRIDKIKAIQFLNKAGAFLVTKSGDKVAKYFGISKYTLYSYIDANKDGDK